MVTPPGFLCLLAEGWLAPPQPSIATQNVNAAHTRALIAIALSPLQGSPQPLPLDHRRHTLPPAGKVVNPEPRRWRFRCGSICVIEAPQPVATLSWLTPALVVGMCPGVSCTTYNVH